MTKLVDIFHAKLSGAESPLTEAKNKGRTKLKPWATELAAIIEKARPNTEFGIGGMASEGEVITKAEMKKIIDAFKAEGYKVRKGQHGFTGDYIDSKTDPKKGVFFQVDPWDEGDKNVVAMAWAD